MARFDSKVEVSLSQTDRDLLRRLVQAIESTPGQDER